MRKKIKILFVIDHFYGPSGGTEGQLYTLLNTLDKEIFHVELCIFRYNSNYFQTNNFPCHYFSLNIDSFYQPSSYFKLLFLRNYIKKNHINIVHTFFNETAVSVPVAACGTGSKIISSRRDMGFWYTNGNLFLLRIISRFVDKYLANSYAVKANTVQKEKLPDKKVAVIYNAHDFSRFNVEKDPKFLDNQKIPKGYLIIGIVANFRPVKRVDDLLKAFPFILKHHPKTILIVIGHHGGLKENYLRLADSLGIHKNIRFIDNTDNVIPIIKHFNVGVLCSESEGMSNVLIEYISCEIPVVATRTGGNVELIRHEKTGLLVPVGNIGAISDAVLKLLQYPQLGRKMIKNAKQSIEDMFNADTIIRQYETFYQKLVR